MGLSADLAVPDYVPVSPIGMVNVLGHLIFGARGGKMYLTVAGGRVLYQAGRTAFVDEAEVIRRAAGVARSLHDRYYKGGAFSARG